MQRRPPISDIGAKAGVVANADGKIASAHDLRRTGADRLLDADLEERDVQAVLRHTSGETTRRYDIDRNLQRSAAEDSGGTRTEAYLGTSQEKWVTSI